MGQLLDGEEALHAMEMGVKVLQRTYNDEKVRAWVLPSAAERGLGWLDWCMLSRCALLAWIDGTLPDAGACNNRHAHQF